MVKSLAVIKRFANEAFFFVNVTHFISMKKSILEVVHESVEGLYDAGLVDVTTMREFNAVCLTPVLLQSVSVTKTVNPYEDSEKKCRV